MTQRNKSQASETRKENIGCLQTESEQYMDERHPTCIGGNLETRQYALDAKEVLKQQTILSSIAQ